MAIQDEAAQTVDTPVLPPPWRRVAMIVSYSLATIVLITVILLVVESEECLEGRRCSTADRLLEAVLEVLALGALAAWIVLGWWGRLPGARACSVQVPGVLANAGGRMVEPVERACESSSADAGPPVPPVGAGQRGRGALRLVKTGAIWLGGLALLAAVGAQTLGVVWLAQRLEDLPSLQSAATIAVDELVESGAFTPGRPYDPVADGRRVVFTSAINPTTVKPVVERLLLLDSRDPKTPIDLFLWSHGGWGGAAFAVIDAMYSIRAPVNVQAIGHCFSACALILVSATGTRTVAPHALLMVHANLDEPEGEAADLFRYLPAYNERFERLWREHAALPDDWFPMTRGETYYLTPQQALELKVVDRIVGGRGR